MSNTHISHCRALCFAENFNLNKLRDRFNEDSGVTMHRFPKLLFIAPSSGSFEMAIFEYGSVVFWGNKSLEDVAYMQDWLNIFAKTRYPTTEMEQFSVTTGTNTHVYGNTITLGAENMATKIAVSYALAQAVKLNQYENQVERTMSELEHLPETLSKTGRISIGKHEALKKTGTLFVVKSQINLHSDLLDTPDYFWDRPDGEAIYLATIKEMDLSMRISNLNKRLDIMKDLYDLLTDHIHNAHSHLLEIIIIVLLCFEIFLSLTSLYLGNAHI